MILTVTLNPAVDLDFMVGGLRPGGRYRTDISRRSPGGSGVNISIVLSRLGLPSMATGFLAGFNGSYILEALRKEKISSNFIYTEGETRINVCVTDTENNSETRLHERGVEISEPNMRAFLKNYGYALGRASKVCIGGSLPPGIDASIYAPMMRLARENAVPTILHPRKEDLEAVLEEAPTVVKLDYQSPLDAFMAKAGELRAQGTEWAVMSLERGKTVFSSPKGTWLAQGREEEMIYVYATEDALWAGMVYAMQERASSEEIVRWAMACCWECATHPEKFPKDRKRVEELTSQVVLSKVD
jgi:1-phosphofructokinase family hexose kinase